MQELTTKVTSDKDVKKPAKLVKFNEKVRKSMKIKKQKKSKNRKTSKDREEKHKSTSRNSSLNQLKDRVNKRIINSHMTAEKVRNRDDSEHEDGYDPLKRQIGLDFLQFVKKKSNHHKMFLSTQKSGFNLNTGSKLEKTK